MREVQHEHHENYWLFFWKILPHFVKPSNHIPFAQDAKTFVFFFVVLNNLGILHSCSFRFQINSKLLKTFLQILHKKDQTGRHSVNWCKLEICSLISSTLHFRCGPYCWGNVASSRNSHHINQNFEVVAIHPSQSNPQKPPHTNKIKQKQIHNTVHTCTHGHN